MTTYSPIAMCTSVCRLPNFYWLECCVTYILWLGLHVHICSIYLPLCMNSIFVERQEFFGSFFPKKKTLFISSFWVQHVYSAALSDLWNVIVRKEKPFISSYKHNFYFYSLHNTVCCCFIFLFAFSFQAGTSISWCIGIQWIVLLLCNNHYLSPKRETKKRVVLDKLWHWFSFSMLKWHEI